MAHGGAAASSALAPTFTTFKNYFTVALGLKRKDVALKRLKAGSQVIAGTILGRVGKPRRQVAPHMIFELRPAGKGAPRIDPKPILDGWKLLEATAIYRAAGKNPFFGADAKNPSIGQILLMSKESLAAPRARRPARSRSTPAAAATSRPGSSTAASSPRSSSSSPRGLKPTVTALECGHSFLTTSGNVSEHSTGDAVDIARHQRHPDPRPPGPGLDHRHHDPPPADAAGHDEAAPDHLA